MGMGKTNGKTIRGEERTVILRVLHFFEEEKQKGSIIIPVDQALRRTSVATGVSMRTISRIKMEERNILQTSQLSTPSSCSEDTVTIGRIPTPEITLSQQSTKDYLKLSPTSSSIEEENRTNMSTPVDKVLKSTCDETGISLSTTTQIKKEPSPSSPTFSSEQVATFAPIGKLPILRTKLHQTSAVNRKGLIWIPVDQIFKKTCADTGVCLSTITRIKREVQPLPSSTPMVISDQASKSWLVRRHPVVVLPTPGTKRSRPSHKTNVDDDTISSLRNIINRFTSKKEIPTIKKVLAVAKEELNFPGQKESMRKVLIDKLGYGSNKCVKKRRFLMDRPPAGSLLTEIKRKK